jgi:hypothetical protein
MSSPSEKTSRGLRRGGSQISPSKQAAGRRRPRFAPGAAFAAALIGLAHAPAARADTEPDPFEDLFGTTGISTWTVSADSSLLSSDPTFAANLDASVDNFLTIADSNYGPDVEFSELAYFLDPSSFNPDAGFLFGSCIGCDITPLDSTGEFALGLDYAVYASGLWPIVDPLVLDLVQLSQLPDLFLAFLVVLGIPIGL